MSPQEAESSRLRPVMRERDTAQKNKKGGYENVTTVRQLSTCQVRDRHAQYVQAECQKIQYLQEK